MYALKKITVTQNGRQVEEVHALGNWYRLEMKPEGIAPEIIAHVEHGNEKGGIPVISIHQADEAYITTLTGETIRHICRGDHKEREKLAAKRRSSGGMGSQATIS